MEEIIKTMADAGMKLVIISQTPQQIQYKLEGVIRWVNDDGTTTDLEEHGFMNSAEDMSAEDFLINLCKTHYLMNVDRYTNFIDSGEK